VGVASDVTLQQIGGSWSYSATATPSNNQYYLVGALEHEITEVMGRTSYLPVRNEYGVMDLYRYKASGVRQTGTGGPAYFSTNSGATNLDTGTHRRAAISAIGREAPAPTPSSPSTHRARSAA
jgi:hypothetical protein